MTTENTDLSATLGFVVQCLAQGVITNAELRAWAEEALVAGEDCPLWVEGLAEFDGAVGDVARAVGFPPCRAFSSAEIAALEWIKTLRAAVSQPPAGLPAAALDRCPAILEEFQHTFPWLKLTTSISAARP